MTRFCRNSRLTPQDRHEIATMNVANHRLPLAAIIATLLFSSAPSSADVGDNPGYQQAYTDWAAAHLALLPTSFLPGPFGTAADLATIGIDIRLRYLPAKFIAPTPSPVTPNAQGGCRFEFTLPQKKASYGNLFNLWDIQPLPTNWGAFGTPLVAHGNSQVDVSVDSPYLDTWSASQRRVSFPSGVHHLDWLAETQLDPIFDVAIPTVLFVYNAELKYGEAITKTEPKSAARAAAIGKEFLKNAAISAGVIGADALADNPTIGTARHEQQSNFTVYDINPPTISTSAPNPSTLEATRFGGEKWYDHFADFRATITAGDPCGLTPTVGNDAPDFLPIGTTVVTWTASDIGPLGAGNPGIASVQQTITVADTLAPILLAPPSQVIESSTPPLLGDVPIGSAAVFDLADPDPALSSITPASFPVDARTEVQWTATDDSGNSSHKSQWITVKTPGTNTPPSVQNVSGTTLTSQPIDLVLSGSDGDLLSGRFDPLNFRISQQPAHGFFVAPLRPYFIEDFRVKPDSEVGDIINYSSTTAADLDDAFCHAASPRPVPVDFPYEAKFVHLRDDDVAYVLDKAWRCTNGYPVTDPRISMWDADGALLTSTPASFGFSDINRVTVDSGGGVQAVAPASNNEWLVLRRYTADLSSFQSWELRDKAPLNRTMKHIAATYDPSTGIIYATDKQYLYAYDGNSGGTQPPYIGALNGGAGFLSAVSSAAGSSTAGFTMEIDSTGALYIPDPGTDRIYKFAPSDYDGVTFTPGALVGWMGRCDSGPNCDDANGRSFGYSCTDATCSVATTSGSAPGQFDTPLGMALDPKDMLYVTDYENYRVQRFTPLGDFAGQAASTCDGGCFVLGDMGKPTDISVNASKFHVLDREYSLLHVFETAPFKDITESSVTVAYASDNDFQGTDSFQFRANDGLVDSNTGTASITVNRNFRAPEAHDASHSLDEDAALDFVLDASDPDGITGVDFNGLDTLTYSIVQLPEHGTLSGSGANRHYTPDADYSGDDAIAFRVNDGRFDSNIAVVTLTVNPVNDPPVVRFTNQNSRIVPKKVWPLLRGKIAGSALQAGRGFPFPLLAEYDDPDIGQPHFVQIAWGDGSSQSSNDVTPMDPNADPKPPVITPTHDGLGQVVAEHIYTDLGSRTIDVTLLDGSGTDGNVQTTVEVIDMIDLTIEETPASPDLPPPGSQVTMLFDVGNATPQGGVSGINATGVRFEGTLPAGVVLVGVTPGKGSCSHVDPVTTCDIGTLTPGETTQISITVQAPVAFDPDENPYYADVDGVESDAGGDNLLSVAIPVQSFRIFEDSFGE